MFSEKKNLKKYFLNGEGKNKLWGKSRGNFYDNKINFVDY